MWVEIPGDILVECVPVFYPFSDCVELTEISDWKVSKGITAGKRAKIIKRLEGKIMVREGRNDDNLIQLIYPAARELKEVHE